MIRLLLVDDQDLFRQGLATMLSIEADLDIVGQATNGQEAIQAAKLWQPQVILMDVRMPVCDGVQATQEIHQYYPWIRVLVLTTFDDDEYILRSLQAGALGYWGISSSALRLQKLQPRSAPSRKGIANWDPLSPRKPSPNSNHYLQTPILTYSVSAKLMC